MNKLKVLMSDGRFLWKPVLIEHGKTSIEGPYCMQCRVELQEVSRSMDNGDFPYEVFAYCVKCHEEVKIGVNFFFDNLRETARLKIASKDLRDYKVLSLDELPDQKAAVELTN